MSTNTNREVREVRELSVQELETVSGGWFPFSLANYEQYLAAKAGQNPGPKFNPQRASRTAAGGGARTSDGWIRVG